MSVLEKTVVMTKRIISKYIYRSNNRDSDLWVFGEWFGKRCDDNSMYLANFVASHYMDINIVWIARKQCIGLERLDDRITVVEMDSSKSIDILKKAGVFFVNEGLQDLSSHGYNYSYGGIIVNLWHGVPWKKIGLDSYKKNEYLKKLYAKIIYSYQSFTLFPSSSDACSKSLKSGFALSDTDIIKSGLPRNSIFFDNDKINIIKNMVLEKLKQESDVIDNKTKIITYMPTFRDSGTETFDFNNLMSKKKFADLLKKNNIVIIQKAHIANKIEKKNDQNERIITLNSYSAQELMAASDILVTDYSSCFFDFLLLNRPIIHYIYDYREYYNNDRGLYYNKEDVVCGDEAFSTDELIAALEKNVEDVHNNEKLRRSRCNQYMTYESSDSCKIITSFVIKRLKNKNY